MDIFPLVVLFVFNQNGCLVMQTVYLSVVLYHTDCRHLFLILDDQTDTSLCVFFYQKIAELNKIKSFFPLLFYLLCSKNFSSVPESVVQWHFK